MIDAFTPLAVGVGRRYHRGEEPVEDLVQVALEGLVKALERFDCGRGSPFVTYALPTMSGEVRRHFRDTGWSVHVARSDQEMAQRIRALERASQTPLTTEEVAERLGVDPEDVISGRLVWRALRADSLDRPSDEHEGDERPRYAPIAIEPGYARAEDRATIAQLTEDLPAREREVLARRYAGHLTQSEIGARLGISQMHVSRILRRTLDELAEQASDVAA